MAPPFLIITGSKTAISQVFTNVDLMEDILLRLPLREILSFNGVCKGWQKVYNESPRIQKVLFLSPATEHKIYYPNCEKPTWYLAPDREDLLEAGFAPKDDYDEDDDITPTNSPRRRTPAKPANTKKEVKFAEGLDVFNGKHAVIFDGKSRNPINFTPAGRHQRAGCGGSGMSIGASGENTCRAMVLYTGSGNGIIGTPVKGMDDFISNMNPFGQKGNGKVTTPVRNGGKNGRQRTKIPPRMDNKMMVRRVIPPIVNPFFELFFHRFYRGIRAEFYPENAVPPYRLPDPYYTGDLVIHPQMRHGDGTTETILYNGKPAVHSRKTRAVLRYAASWRKMHPFSATTSSIEVECFDFGSFEVFCDWGMLCGSLMEQLGEHWSQTCPECCIPHFWFDEFIKKGCHTDGSHVNRSKHGVRKLGSVDMTGWEILTLLNTDPVRPMYFQDRIRPY